MSEPVVSPVPVEAPPVPPPPPTPEPPAPGPLTPPVIVPDPPVLARAEDGLVLCDPCHYVLGGPSDGTRNAGECRPAWVVRVWPGEWPGPTEDAPRVPGYNVEVLVDGSNDSPMKDDLRILWRTSCKFVNDIACREPGTLHRHHG